MWNNHISSITGGTRKCYSHWGQVSGSIFFIFFLKKNKQTRVLAALGLVAEHGLSLVAVSGGYSLGSRLLIAVASHCRAGALFTWASGVVAHGLIALRHVGSSPNRDGTCVPCIGRWILNHWTTRKSQNSYSALLVCLPYSQLFSLLISALSEQTAICTIIYLL